MISLFLSLAFLTNSYANDPANCPDCEVVHGFEQIDNTLSTDFNAPVTCSSFDGTPNSMGCSFESMCKKLSANAEAGYLYENSNGEKIPNYNLQEIEMAVLTCEADKKHPDTASSRAENINALQKKESEITLKGLKLQSAFEDSIRAHHEEEAYFEISSAATSLALKKAESDKNADGMASMVVSRDEIAKNLDEMEGAAGKTLSPETKKAYIDAQYQELNENFQYDKARQDLSKVDLPSRNIDPFLDPELFVDETKAGGKAQLLKNQAALQNGVNRIYGIFQTVQQQILSYLDERKTPENAQEIESMKKRIQTIRLDTDAHSLLDMSTCPEPNAFYNPDDHQFHVCPQVMELPSETLKMIIAHELSHSMDPCSLSDDLLMVDGKDPDTLIQDDGQKAGMKKVLEAQGYFEPEIKDPQPASEHHYVIDSLGMIRPQLSSRFVDPQSSVLSNAIPFSGQPFYSTIACIGEKTSIGARATNEVELASSLDKMIAKAKASGATKQNSPDLADALDTRAHLHELVSKHGGCSFMGGKSGKSQLQEAFADKMATEIVARDLSNKTPAEKQEGVFEAAGFFLAISCPNVNAKLTNQFNQMKKQQDCFDAKNQSVDEIKQIFQAQERDSNEHPWDIDRINRLLLAQPALRRDFGCSGIPQARYCP